LLPGMEPVRGRESMRALLLQAVPQARTLEILEYGESFEETQVFGDVALEWGYVWGAERPREGGAVQRTRYKVMRVLKRQPDGSWRFHRSIFNDAPVR
jgi:ketosteroid isomerase-like protein